MGTRSEPPIAGDTRGVPPIAGDTGVAPPDSERNRLITVS